MLLLLHVARGFYIVNAYPPRCSCLLSCVYRLLAVVHLLLAIVYSLLACLPLTACYCLSLTAYPLATITAYPLTRLPAYPLACYCLPLTACYCLPLVYRLPTLLAGAALDIAHTRVADRIAYPYGV